MIPTLKAAWPHADNPGMRLRTLALIALVLGLPRLAFPPGHGGLGRLRFLAQFPLLLLRTWFVRRRLKYPA
jgi:hypothetical protein